MATAPQGDTGKPNFGPSPHLITLMRACSKDPTEEIKERLDRMLHEFLEHYGNKDENEKTKESVKQCCHQAALWYYKILENIANQEKARLGTSDLVILGQDQFQRGLVMCCLEIAAVSDSLPCNFPRLLQIFKLSAYSFPHVIEQVIRFGLDGSHALLLHLSQVERKVLKSLAWTSDSPLWDDIRGNQGHLPTCQQVMPPEQIKGSQETDVKPDQALGEHVSLEAGPSALTDQQPSFSGVNRGKGNFPLVVFSRKVYTLMDLRLTELCSELGISDQLKHNIWTCLEYALAKHTRIMVNRNLDHLLLCAIYNTAKVCGNMLISKKAEEILPIEVKGNEDHTYMILTPTTPSGEPESGIGLYEAYRMKMQHFTERFTPTWGGDTPPLSPYPKQRTQSSRSVRLPGYNITISPMIRGAPTPLTPKFCYNLNSRTPENLREINNKIRTSISRSAKRLISFDNENEEDKDAPSFKRRCLNFDRRLMTLAKDRAEALNQNQEQNQKQPSLPEDPHLQLNTEGEGSAKP